MELVSDEHGTFAQHPVVNTVGKSGGCLSKRPSQRVHLAWDESNRDGRTTLAPPTPTFNPVRDRAIIDRFIDCALDLINGLLRCDRSGFDVQLNQAGFAGVRDCVESVIVELGRDVVKDGGIASSNPLIASSIRSGSSEVRHRMA